MRFLDPACGCGNFLVIAYREMRQLELDIMVRLSELTGQEQLSLDATLGLRVSPSQFHGIEVEEWPARIAETAMFLIDHQCNQILARTFGQAPDRLPISTAADIRVANAIELDWHTVLPAGDDVYVIGNPPFIGMAWLTPEQQADNRRAFPNSSETLGLRTGRLDYVACWYAKAIDYLKGTRGRCAFVSTNSITQGEQARTMVPLLARSGFKVDFAHRAFRWTSEAPGVAAVHVVIVGFSQGGQAKTKRLFRYSQVTGEPQESNPSNINFYLEDADDVSPEKRFAPFFAELPLASKGSQPTDGGHLIVGAGEVADVQRDAVANKYLRPFQQAGDMLNGVHRWCLWLVDAEPQDLRSSPVIKQRLQAVATVREQSPTESVRRQAATPALFTQRRQPECRYFAMPEASSGNREYIPGRFFDAETIAGNQLIVFPDPPLWLVGYLQSAAFTTWLETVGGKLKSDFRISPGLAYFAFPFAVPHGSERDQVDGALQAVMGARNAHPASTLADLYDPLTMPADLRAAHTALDKVIDGLYGLKNPSEGERLRALLARYEALRDADQLPLGETNGKRKGRRTC